MSFAICIVVDTKSETSERMGSKVMFHVGGIATLTFLVNATTCSKLISQLNLAGTSSMRKKVLRCIVDGVYARAKTISSEEDDPAFRGANQGVIVALPRPVLWTTIQSPGLNSPLPVLPRMFH